VTSPPASGGGAPSARPPYDPRPLDTSHIALPPQLTPLLERLAENAHDAWARQRMSEGWRYGPARDDARREHPGLVPYAELSEAEKEYDRIAVGAALRYILALGYRIVAPKEAG
jgi:ryanodine receptor 2